MSHPYLSTKSDYQSQIFKGSVSTLQVAKITFSHFRLQEYFRHQKKSQSLERIVILLPFMAKTSNSTHYFKSPYFVQKDIFWLEVYFTGQKVYFLR